MHHRWSGRRAPSGGLPPLAWLAAELLGRSRSGLDQACARFNDSRRRTVPQPVTVRHQLVRVAASMQQPHTGRVSEQTKCRSRDNACKCAWQDRAGSPNGRAMQGWQDSTQDASAAGQRGWYRHVGLTALGPWPVPCRPFAAPPLAAGVSRWPHYPWALARAVAVPALCRGSAARGRPALRLASLGYPALAALGYPALPFAVLTHGFYVIHHSCWH